jgi:predicted N-acetyltransferase YhbS
MDLTQIHPVRTEYLRLVTELVQSQRLADPFAGLWEAADLQWWYTRDPQPSDRYATVWLAGDRPTAAAVFTRWSATRYGCVVLGDPSFAPAWTFVRERCAELAGASIEMEIDPADALTLAEATHLGFTDTGDAHDVTWLDAADRAAPRAAPEGYVLADRTMRSGPHPMIRRNGSEVAALLDECSLYDPALDLAVLAPDGEVAGYAMFWADPVTKVGLVEPMRVEEAHGGRGLAGTLLREGLDRLAARGCARLKICHEVSNPVAGSVYSGAGFATQSRIPMYCRPPLTTDATT